MVALLRALLRIISHRSLFSMITAATALILGFLTLTAGSQRVVASGAAYYVAPDGYDSNPGTLDQPWRTIGHALKQLYAGDTLYIRGGTYASPSGGWYLIHSGTADQPITITNQPGEQVVVKVSEVGIWYSPFVCNSEGSGQKADYVRLAGSNVTPRTLSNGLSSSKGIVIQGPDTGYTDAAGVRIWDCDYWEVSGLDLIRMGYGLFGHTFGNEYWYVHHNRVYANSREAGIQFNGPHHTIEYNEVIRDRPDYQSPYGCSHIALLAYGNAVRGNLLDYVQPMRNQQGGVVDCVGILLEWDIADDNIIEANIIHHMDKAFDFAGGDNNIVRNNIILTGNSGYIDAGFYIRAYPDGTNSWPCNNEWLQPSNPSDPAYAHFWNPRNCHSRDNQIYNNVVVGFKKGVLFDNRIPEGNTYVRNNAFVNLREGGICNWSRCGSFDGVTEDHNVFNAPYGFVDEAHQDFHLLSTSPLRDVGYNLGDLVSTDFDGYPRPQGAGYDVGAYECPGESVATATPSPIPTSAPTTAPTATATSTPTATPTTAPTATATSTPTATPTAAPAATLTPSPTATPITAPTASEMSTPTATPTAAPIATATPSPTATPTATATSSPSPTPNPNEIIIDDTDAGFSTSFSQDAWEEYVQAGGRHYGGSHYHNPQIGTGQDTAMWSFHVPMPGRYEVYTWWWEGNWRPTDVGYTINHLGGSTVVRVNQQTNGGQWNLLGTFEFLDQGSLVVSDDPSSGHDVVADAVRLVYLKPSTWHGKYRMFFPVVQQLQPN